MSKVLEKIPIDKLYDDLFHPSLKRAGKALSTVLDLGLTVLLPIKLLNEKAKLNFISNMKRYEEKLSAMNEEELIDVPEYIGLPILEKLTYISESFISEAFINLLSTASSEKTIDRAHPSFLSTLNDLSSDEAKILFRLKDKTHFPFIDIYVIRELEKVKKPAHIDINGPKKKEEILALLQYNLQDRNTTPLRAAWNLTGIEKECELQFPENIDLYLNNFERHNLIEFNRDQFDLSDISFYENLENYIYKDIHESFRNEIGGSDTSSEDFKYKIDIRRGAAHFTDYGRIFISACVSQIKLTLSQT